MSAFEEILNRNFAYHCLDCGKCSAVCPVTRWETNEFASPRLLVEKALNQGADAVFDSALFRLCLTCKRCSQLCPSEVYFPEFIRDARHAARQNGHRGGCTHGDVIQTWARIMTDPDIRQQRLGWLSDELRVSGDSDTLLFVGCLPYYDRLFQPLGIEGVSIVRAAVKLLNAIGVAPQVMADERCCGHDQLWQGDLKTFMALARLNLERLAATGAGRIVTPCPECARTLSVDYPRLAGAHGMQVFHISQIMAEAASTGKLPLARQKRQGLVTFHDPCRLGRHLGIYDAPRTLMKAMGFQVKELELSRQASLCCGTSCWTACGRVSKNIQVERLQQARATGADMLVTACVKCQIHFRCAQQDPGMSNELTIDIRDITTLAAEQLAEPITHIDGSHAGRRFTDRNT